MSFAALVFSSSLVYQIVRGGVEPPPTTYQIAVLPLHHRTDGKFGVEPIFSCSQGTRGAVPLPPVVLALSSSYGSRTHLSALKGPDPQTDRRTSHTSARTLTSVGREALESSSPGFQPSATPSQLPTQLSILLSATTATRRNKKGPMSRDTRPLNAFVRRRAAECHKRSGCAGLFPARVSRRAE